MFFVQAGFLMNIVCLVTVALSINTYAVPLFDLNRSKSEKVCSNKTLMKTLLPTRFPDWASAKLENASMCTLSSNSPLLVAPSPTTFSTISTNPTSSDGVLL